jgi:hypothetical protein
MSVVETPPAVITNEVLDGYYALAGDALKANGLLEPSGDQRTAACLVDHDDEPIDLIWSGEHMGYGYFSAASGWITVPNTQLASFRVNFDKLFEQVIARLDRASQRPAAVLIPDLLWEIGDVRLPGRSKRVPVWIARRLADPAVWGQFTETVRLRPASGLRVVLTLSSANRLAAQIFHGHEIIAVRDVAASDGLAVDPDLLAARIGSGAQQGDLLISIAADGAAITVRGQRYAFPGSKQRAIIRQLYAAWATGNAECITTVVLDEAGFSDSVNTLAKAFSRRTDWREFIKEDHGRCWMFT